MVSELIRRRLLMAEGLPYDAEVEWLGGAAGTFINTQIIGDSSIEMDIVYSLTSHANYAGIYGNYINETANCVRAILTNVNNNNGYVNTGQRAENPNTCNGVGRKNNVNHLIANSSSIVINGSTYTSNTVSGLSNSTNIALFSSSTTTTPSGTINLKIFSCKIKQNGTLVRDFIPVRVGTTGYMYDKVSKQLFGNAGTGAFILGNDK